MQIEINSKRRATSERWWLLAAFVVFAIWVLAGVAAGLVDALRR